MRRSKAHEYTGIWLMGLGGVGWMLTSVVAGLEPGFPNWLRSSLHALAVMVAAVGAVIWFGEARLRRSLERISAELAGVRRQNEEANLHLYRQAASSRIASQEALENQTQAIESMHELVRQIGQGVAGCVRRLDDFNERVPRHALAPHRPKRNQPRAQRDGKAKGEVVTNGPDLSNVSHLPPPDTLGAARRLARKTIRQAEDNLEDKS